MSNSSVVKQVIVVRKDLNMRKGKIAAQAAHASLAVILGQSYRGPDGIVIKYSDDLLAWLNGPFTKICVSVDSEEELLSVHKQAENAGLPCSLIRDAGHTEFNGVLTYTTVAIGPAKSKDIDKITGLLKLL